MTGPRPLWHAMVRFLQLVLHQKLSRLTATLASGHFQRRACCRWPPPPHWPTVGVLPAPCCPAAGADFEKRILANESNNQKFNFLKEGDPYNAYYRQKVRLGSVLLTAVAAKCWTHIRAPAGGLAG